MANMRAKRWNERLRLVIAFLNITSVGAFGLAITAPVLERLRFIRAVEGGDPLFEKFSFVQDLSVTNVIEWRVATAALVLHVFAHILVTFTEPEE